MHGQEQTNQEFHQDGSLPKAPVSCSDLLVNHIEISVSESEKRNNGALNLRDHYTVYLIETKLNKNSSLEDTVRKHATVWRRYTEFEQLRSYLEIEYPYIVLPPLPEKRVMFGWEKISSDTFDPNFIDRRRAGLENFLLRVASHPVLCWDKHFLEFLQDEEGWHESYKANGYLQLVESKLRTISASIRLKRSHARFEAIKDFSTELQSSLNNFLKARCRVAEKEYIVHKLHSNYGRVFSEWSANEKEMGDALQKTGHYLDSLASCIDAALEDEELLADQLKEYLFFANSLHSVCKNREILQLKLEDSEESVANKNVERTKVQQGKSGLMSRLFGAVDTDEVKELKVSELDQQIQEGAVAVNNYRDNLRPNEVSDRLKGDGASGASNLLCPAPISRLRVEKIEGGLMVAGVVVAANCQIILPIFGFLFLLVGCVLTAASYRGPGEDEEPDDYAERIAFTGNSRILGPACMVIGILMLIASCILCILTQRARRREQTIGFHCPLHGDFYPLSPVTSSKTLEIIERNGKCSLCWPRKRGPGAIAVGPPQCPHSQVSSTRSSIASSHSQCPTPLPFLVNSGPPLGGITAASTAQQSPAEQSFGSIRSLAVGREVASFPMSRTPTPPLTFERSQDMVNIPDHQRLVDSQFETVPVHREGPRKSVSIVLPTEEKG